MRLTTLLMMIFLVGCTGIPENIKPVGNFDLQRYLGQWYEIARLDHSFERGLSNVTATYSTREDGGVRVINRGYSDEKQQWKEAEGKAYFVQSADIGYLKVSFFGPFYGAYVIIELDHAGYQYALISGPNKSYLWILARTPTLEPALVERLVAKATALGYNTEQLLFVNQSH